MCITPQDTGYAGGGGGGRCTGTGRPHHRQASIFCIKEDGGAHQPPPPPSKRCIFCLCRSSEVRNKILRTRLPQDETAKALMGRRKGRSEGSQVYLLCYSFNHATTSHSLISNRPQRKTTAKVLFTNQTELNLKIGR